MAIGEQGSAMTFTSAVVTGAGSGLGRAIALRLARPGAKLLLADINLEACEETARMVESRGATAHAKAVDVSDAAQVEALAADADQRLGRIDLVVNNAGVAAAGTIGQAPLDDWRWIIGINLMGVIHGCHFFAPRLVAQGGGAILNTASMAGFACAPMMGVVQRHQGRRDRAERDARGRGGRQGRARHRALPGLLQDEPAGDGARRPTRS